MPYFDDDGNEIDPATIPMPQMCLMCEKKDDLDEDIYCTLNRMGQRNETSFECHAFVSIYGPLIDDTIK